MVAVPDAIKSLGFTEEFLASRRARFIPDADASVLNGIGCGVLFFMAFWSIYSRQAFAELKRILEQVDPEARLELVVVDVDSLRGLENVPGLTSMQPSAGAGETAWVKDGRVVATSGHGLRVECFGPNIRSLLEQC
jgi:hypothetical protein